MILLNETDKLDGYFFFFCPMTKNQAMNMSLKSDKILSLHARHNKKYSRYATLSFNLMCIKFVYFA